MSNQLNIHKIPLGARLFCIRHGVTFRQALDEAISTPELVANFDRLYGATLSGRKTPIESMVDKATGKQEEDIKAFIEFVWDGIFMRFGPNDGCPAVTS